MTNTSRTIRFGLIVSAITLVLAGAACDNDPVVPAVEGGADLENLEPGIHPILVFPGTEGPAGAAPQSGIRVAIHLKRVEVKETLASYQGVLTFDADMFTVEAVETPDGVMGSWHETEPGTLRFAGISADGLPAGAVLTIRFKGGGTIAPATFGVTIEELTAAGSFADVTDRVVEREQPLQVWGGLSDDPSNVDGRPSLRTGGADGLRR